MTRRSTLLLVPASACIVMGSLAMACVPPSLEELQGHSSELTSPCPSSSPSAPPMQNVAVVAKHSGKCLDVAGGPTAVADAVRIDQWTCTGEANQAWTFVSAGDDSFQISAKSSGKCLDLVAGGTANRTRIQQSTCSPASATQKWKLRDLGDGFSEIGSVAAGRCLDVLGGPMATADFTPMELWDCSGEANQAWSIGKPVATTPPPAPATKPSAGGGSGPFGQDASQYELTFSDEFDGARLDTSRWVDHIWYLPEDPTPNYEVSGGSLKIWPVPGTDLKQNYRDITTDGIYYQTYGYFEMEAKLPYGRGPWPAFWLLNHDSGRPEIDIMEAYSGGGPDSGWSDASLHPTAFGATIWLDAGQEGGHKVLQTPDLSAGFHRYAVKWEPNKQTYYFDGQPFYSADVSMGSRMYILLSYQFGSASGTPDGSTPTGKGNAYEINYVRAWKTK